MSNIITTTNNTLRLYRFNESFISDRYISWLNDSNLMRYSRQRHTAHTIESCRSYLQSFENSPNHFFAAVDQIDGRHVGNVAIYINTYSNVADIAIMMGERRQNGKGYGKQAWGLAMAYLFDKQSLRKITAGTMACNLAMIKVAQHWHMKQEALLRQQDIFEGTPVDIVRFGILQEEWRILNNRPILDSCDL
jgi:RimJ/RimL family protein N-acetyltransferase